MQKLNILLVSIAFPPKRDPESLQVLKYYTELRKNDLDISVVTSKSPTLFMEVDESLYGYCSGYKQLIELKITENKYLNFAKRKINPHMLNYPDSKYTFHEQSRLVIKQLESIPDVIYSRSFPLSSTFLAYELASFYNKPWVLHLSDPWTFKTVGDKNLSKSDIWNIEKEKLFFEKASRISLTSKKTIEWYRARYPQFKEKFTFSPNVYNRDEVTEIVKEESRARNTLKFVYTGGLTKQRSPLFFLECLKEMNLEIPNLNELIQFDFIGPKDSFVSNLETQFNISCLNFRDSVTYEESKKMQLSADVLLLIDSDVTDGHLPVFFPSKILDYMITRKPILALTPSGSTTEEVLDSYGLGNSFDYSNMESLKTYLIECINGNVDLSVSKKGLPKDFDAKFNADKLYNLFLQLDAESKENSDCSRD